MKIDIMSSIFGSKSVVEQCIDSWYPMPDKFTVNLYNNKKSNDDGTTNMLLEKNKIHNFHLTSEDINLRHADALNKLIEVTTGDWILILDSDAYLKNKNFYNWIDEVTNRTDTLFWGTTRIYRPRLQLGWNPRIPTYLMPRADSWIMLINRKFINDYELKPNPLRVEGNLTEGSIFYKNFSDDYESTYLSFKHIQILLIEKRFLDSKKIIIKAMNELLLKIIFLSPIIPSATKIITPEK